MKIRLTIEYDPDMPEGEDPDDFLEGEKQDWVNGHVSVLDFLGPDGFVAADDSIDVSLEIVNK